MAERRRLLTGLGSALLLVGCAGTNATTISDDRVARLPLEAQQSILEARRNVDVAQANLSAARAAKDDSKQFQKAAAYEVDAANSQLDAARAELDLAHRSAGAPATDRTRAAFNAAERLQAAARAKKEYADRLVDLRDAQIEEETAALDLAQADLQYTKFVALRRQGMDRGLDANAFIKARQETQNGLAAERMRVAQLQGDVASTRTAWDQRRRAFNTAARDLGTIGAPPAPPRLPEQPQ